MFGFENAEVSKGNYKETIKPGINLVKVVKIENGLSSKAQAPQITFTVNDNHGAELAQTYSLNTVVNPGKKMSGHLGDDTVTTQNLDIVRVDEARQLLLIKGAVPGSKGGFVTVRPAVKLQPAQEGAK